MAAMPGGAVAPPGATAMLAALLSRPEPPLSSHTAAPRAADSLVWTAAMPAVFVVLWATGFIASKAGLPYAEPMTFLTARFALVTAAMVAVAVVGRAPWPSSWTQAGHIAIVGLLMHGCYLGGVFAAIFHGMPSGLTALIVGLQPVLTATIVGPLLGDRVSKRQWLGLLLGLIGVALVLWNKLAIDNAGLVAIAFAVLALIGITIGTLYQKRFCAEVDLRTGAVIQYAAAGLAVAFFAVRFETMHIAWTPQFIAALAWLSLPLSLGAVSLLYILIRRGAAAKVASLFYLVPPVTALMAWLLFNETLGPVALAGMAVTAVGVALVQRG
jgi:drug/metabolite transporter (DMT)-like permease